MYLSFKQHDQFRTLLMGFEIPFRGYISDIVTSIYKSSPPFENALQAKNNALQLSDPWFIRNVLPKECRSNKLGNLYNRFATATTTSAIVQEDQDIPMVGALNLVTFSFTSLFGDLYRLFTGYSEYCTLAEKYRYARNKLDHPGCRTLEDSHLVPVLSFVRDICIFLDEQYFIQKSKDVLLSEISVLQQRRIEIPIPKHNLRETPYSEAKIVCRDDEIAFLKSFIYGNQEDLRKQHSCCIYGYGGVGKTALVLEATKQIIRDVIDESIMNNYTPNYLFFFTAKKQRLAVAQETGRIIEQQVRCHFETADELIALVHASLETDSFHGFHTEGLIIVDNLETLAADERTKVKRFIETQTPAEMQFIITSRNCEEFEVNYKLSGFVSENGVMFINSYSSENSLDLELDETKCNEILSLSKGNTLVLVLCMRRLSQKLIDISRLRADFSSSVAFDGLKQDLGKVPPNAYEVISEFMFKNTFEQIETVFSDDIGFFYKILKVFAVVQNNGIDISTVCLLTQCAYPIVESAIDTLCNYLILEKTGDLYYLNQFAEKYIVNRFLPDGETFRVLTSEINQRQREIHDALDELRLSISQRPGLGKIMIDWEIITDCDKITAAKMYKLYGDVKRQCELSSRFKLEAVLEDLIKASDEAEAITAHPYIKYQKARILQLVDHSNVLQKKHTEEIISAYGDAIYVIKTLEQYAVIQGTKSYASLLWLFGQYLYDNNSIQDAIRYLEESKEAFERRDFHDQEYLQSITLLGTIYLEYYKQDRTNRVLYLRRARQISQKLYQNRNELGKARKYALQLKDELIKYGSY